MGAKITDLKNNYTDENFLLTTPLAQRLYFECAKDLPIIDYHNHLSVKDLSDNKKYSDIFELWIKSDPYKHRVMRICGVPEKYITGNESNFEKFFKWCEIFPLIVGNPIFDWSLMELHRIFNIKEIPDKDNCSKIWNTANSMLKSDDFLSQSILKKFNVEYCAPCVSITDDITDLKEKGNYCFSIRCDDLINLDKTVFDKLSKVCSCQIDDIKSLTYALDKRIKYLNENGLRFTDHALDNGFRYVTSDGSNEAALTAVFKEKQLPETDKNALSCHILRILGVLYAKHNIVMQIHIGAQRSTSTRLRNIAGAAGGYAAIGNNADIQSVTQYLNDLEKLGGLPKTLLFCLNPNDHALFSVLSGSFSKDGVEAIVSEGPAWWWCDHIFGIKEMLSSYANYGVLSTFIGMTTDSRSLLSFSRHEYFRRVLCMWIGEKAKEGTMPSNYELLKTVVEKLCYYNAKKVIDKI